MKKKNVKYLFFIAIIIYLLFGLVSFMGIKNTDSEGEYLENNEGQECGLKMSEVEKEVTNKINTIAQQKRDNELDSDILLNEIESSRKYLQENLGKENVTEETALKLLYHSSFLKSLGEYYKINDNNLLSTLKAIHSYMIDELCGSSNMDRENQLKEDVKTISEEKSLEIVKEIMENDNVL